MLQVQVIGNLGADAKVIDNGGRPFVSFSVGHNDTWVDNAGVEHSSTIWCSCTINGNGGNLLQYLVKGKQVFVMGRAQLRVYSSQQERRLVAGLNIMVDRIELLGGASDVVPGTLFTSDAEAVTVHKMFFVTEEIARNCGATAKAPGLLIASNGARFSVNEMGNVIPENALTQE